MEQNNSRQKQRIFDHLQINLYEIKTFISLVLVIIFLSCIPVLIVYYRFRTELVFVPAKFINDYIDLLTGFIPILFGFLLLQLFWNQRQKILNIKKLRVLLHGQLGTVSDLIWDIGIQQDRHISSIEESFRREEKIKSDIMRINDASAVIFSIFDEIIDSSDTELTKKVVMFRTDVQPLILGLTNITDFTPGANDLREYVKQIGDLLEKITNIEVYGGPHGTH